MISPALHFVLEAVYSELPSAWRTVKGFVSGEEALIAFTTIGDCEDAFLLSAVPGDLDPLCATNYDPTNPTEDDR